MNSFKSGSGNLDFGDSEEDDENEEEAEEQTSNQNHREGQQQSTPADRSNGPVSDSATGSRKHSSRASTAENTQSKSGSSAGEEYPYFVRRNNVGDERDTRLEVHVRDRVADQEGEFRSELADQLGTGEVSKTDAREFALLAAFQHPERVAEMMQEEGFGELD